VRKVSTEYYPLSELKIKDVLDNLPDGIVLYETGRWPDWETLADDGLDIGPRGRTPPGTYTMSHRVLLGPSEEEGAKCYLHVFGYDDKILSFDRFGGNKPRKMLEMIAEKTGVRFESCIGARLEDDWF
jgi:hypothetical protein